MVAYSHPRELETMYDRHIRIVDSSASVDSILAMASELHADYIITPLFDLNISLPVVYENEGYRIYAVQPDGGN